MRGMPELSEAILYTHLSANRSSKARETEKDRRTGENEQNDKDRETMKMKKREGEVQEGKGNMIMEEVENRKENRWRNNDSAMAWR